MRWFYSTAEVDELVQSTASVRLQSLSAAVRSSTLQQLEAATCDDQTLLVTLPVQWTLSQAVHTFVNVIASIGLTACAALLLFVVYFRHHPVVRAASPLFLLLSISGLVILFASAFLLVADVSAGSCSAFSWLLNFGLMLTFAPLFAKTWRIYRIFGRRKLSVVVISNRKLLLMVGTLLAAELLLMAVWQGVGNLQPQVEDVQSSTAVDSTVSVIHRRLRVDEYVQCGVPSGGPRSMFIVVCVEKGLLFLWGALMAFSTRKVSSTFNEAQGITLCIYNTLFTLGIIAPIILVIGATGDVLDLLLVFALLWISGFTAAALFGPKVLTVFGKHDDGVQGMNTSVAASSSSGSGYQFMSLAALSTVAALQGYAAALKKHLTEVENRLTKARGQSQAAAGGGDRGSRILRSPSPGTRSVDSYTRKLPSDPLESRVLSPKSVPPQAGLGTPILRPRMTATSVDAGRGARILMAESQGLNGLDGRQQSAGSVGEDSRQEMLVKQSSSSGSQLDGCEPQDSAMAMGGSKSDM